MKHGTSSVLERKDEGLGQDTPLVPEWPRVSLSVPQQESCCLL